MKESIDENTPDCFESGLSVLLVDDQAFVGEVIRRALRSEHDIDLHVCTDAQQAMAVRRIQVAGPGVGPGARSCTFLVSYEGEAEDPNAWLSHYLDRHPPLMAQLPGIRAIEIYTRVDYRSALPAPRAHAMQRNKVVFDDADALAHALASPVRLLMRSDFDALPPFSGATPHFPMASESFEITSAE